MKEIYYVILFPAIAGLLGFIINRLRSELDFLGFFLALYFSIKIFIISQTSIISYKIATIAGIDLRFYLDNLAGLVLLFNAIFAILIWVYSLRAMSKTPKERVYYFYIAMVLSVANCIAVSGNLIFLLILWNGLALLLYGFLLVGKIDSSGAAKKSITIIALADFIMMLGILILSIKLAGKINFPFESRILLRDPWMITSFIMILISGIAKAGVVPLHSWVPEAASVEPASTMAFTTTVVNSLLGTYLLIRMSYFVFDISSSIVLRFILMAIGALTIVIAVIKAITQKEAMQFISFQGITQIGYIIMGIGTGLPIGIAAAIFHMVNNAISKASLFLSLGSIEFRTKTTKFAELGGLRKKLPFTMFAFIIAALAIADIPPLNGFYSKWLLYQGVIQFSKIANLGLIFILVMIFGGAMTLVSFLKTFYVLFLRRSPKKLERVYEPRFEMVTPTLILSLACIMFGIFAKFVLSKIVDHSVLLTVLDFGSWLRTLPTLMIVIGIFLGVVIFLCSKRLRPSSLPISNERFYEIKENNA